MDSLKHIVKAYEKWVAANPDIVCDVETTTKWVSYFVAGRISNSNVVTELIYSLSNLLVFYNDRIIAKARPPSIATAAPDEGVCYRLKVMLTTLEYCEVFVEISAKRVFGPRGRWVCIALLQVIKAAGRFFILRHSTEQIITSPALTALNRRAIIKERKAVGGQAAPQVAPPPGPTDEQTVTFQLKRSGLRIRKVEGAPPMHDRNFQMLASFGGGDADHVAQKRIPQALLNAEYLYISKPLIHLVSMGLFGERSWKQYMVALALDALSIRMYHQNRHLMTKQQKLEMSRRCINLALYLARSPFYERYTQSRLDRVLGFVADNVPIAKMLAGPLREYLPHWQNTYFYLWST